MYAPHCLRTPPSVACACTSVHPCPAPSACGDSAPVPVVGLIVLGFTVLSPISGGVTRSNSRPAEPPGAARRPQQEAVECESLKGQATKRPAIPHESALFSFPSIRVGGQNVGCR